MGNENDKKKVADFMKKCGSIVSKVPMVKELWNKLGDTIK